MKRLVASLGKAAMTVLFFFSFMGCSMQPEQQNRPTLTSDAPLSTFILGEWLSNEVKVESGPGTDDFQYKIIFETETVVKFIVIYPEGGTEGYTFTYKFITPDSIYVDNKHLAGGETWYLEKKDDKLVIRLESSINTRLIVLERIR